MVSEVSEMGGVGTQLVGGNRGQASHASVQGVGGGLEGQEGSAGLPKLHGSSAGLAVVKKGGKKWRKLAREMSDGMEGVEMDGLMVEGGKRAREMLYEGGEDYLAPKKTCFTTDNSG